MLKFYFILEYFKLNTSWVQSDVFSLTSKGFSKIRQIRLFSQGISENLDYVSRFTSIATILALLLIYNRKSSMK